MRIDEDSSAYSESFERVECTTDGQTKLDNTLQPAWVEGNKGQS